MRDLNGVANRVSATTSVVQAELDDQRLLLKRLSELFVAALGLYNTKYLSLVPSGCIFLMIVWPVSPSHRHHTKIGFFSILHENHILRRQRVSTPPPPLCRAV